MTWYMTTTSDSPCYIKLHRLERWAVLPYTVLIRELSFGLSLYFPLKQKSFGNEHTSISHLYLSTHQL